MLRPGSISPFSTIAIFLCLCVMGSYSVTKLKVQVHPKGKSSDLNIFFYWHQVSTRVVEKEVTSKLEGIFNTAKGIESISSISGRGWGNISLTFKKDVNLDVARFEIASLIRQNYSKLPNISYPRLTSSNRDENIIPSYSIALNSSNDPYEVFKYAKNNIIPLLSRLEGINEIRLSGIQPPYYEIKFHPFQLERYAISVEELKNALADFAKKHFIGSAVQHIAGLTDERELSIVIDNYGEDIRWHLVPITNKSGRIIYLTDIATINHKLSDPAFYYRTNGLNTANILIYAKPDVNAFSLASDINRTISTIKQNIQKGYELTIYDSSEYIKNQLLTILGQSMSSLLLILILLWILSRQLKLIVVFVLSILANSIISCLFFVILKVELNVYSIGGITIALGMASGYILVMIYHFKHFCNKSIFPLFAGSVLISIVLLSTVFLVSDELQNKAIDLVYMLMISLLVCLGTTYFLIPALVLKFNFPKSKKTSRDWLTILKIKSIFTSIISTSLRLKKILIIAAFMLVGFPVFLLPYKIEGDSYFASIYNNILGNDTFSESIRPYVEKASGGALRIFFQDIFNRRIYREPSRSILFIRGKMPEGSTIEQINENIRILEKFLKQFNQVELFLTSIRSHKDAEVTIYFKNKFENTNIPYFLKSVLESKVQELGSADWNIHGIGVGFSNALGSNSNTERFILTGYNYDKLFSFADTLKSELLKNPRIKEVHILGNDTWDTSDSEEYFLEHDLKIMSLNDVDYPEILKGLHLYNYAHAAQQIYKQGTLYDSRIESSDSFDAYNLRNYPILIDGKYMKFSNLGHFQKHKVANNIYKKNQEYQLYVVYDFIGPEGLSKSVQLDLVKRMRGILPMGYQIQSKTYEMNHTKHHYAYNIILLILLLIYAICATLFESFWSPLVVILLISISYVGVVYAFYFLDTEFDQGGFASFILVATFVANSCMFIVTEHHKKGRLPTLSAFVKSELQRFHYIVITIFCLIIFLLPYILLSERKVFWNSFSTGVLGGSLIALIAILVYLPLLTIKTRRMKLR